MVRGMSLDDMVRLTTIVPTFPREIRVPPPKWLKDANRKDFLFDRWFHGGPTSKPAKPAKPQAKPAKAKPGKKKPGRPTDKQIREALRGIHIPKLKGTAKPTVNHNPMMY